MRDMPVHIVLPILVLDELDDLKESTKQHTRYRARETLKWLAQRLRSSQTTRIREGLAREIEGNREIRGDVFLDVLLDDPGHQRLPIADDEIVDRAAVIASLSGRDATLITNDTSQAYRARIAGLQVSMVVDPVYDVDVRETGKAAKRAEKQSRRRRRRGAHEQDSRAASDKHVERLH